MRQLPKMSLLALAVVLTLLAVPSAALAGGSPPPLYQHVDDWPNPGDAGAFYGLSEDVSVDASGGVWICGGSLAPAHRLAPNLVDILQDFPTAGCDALGSATDDAGNLYVAEWGTGRVSVWRPDGQLDHTVGTYNMARPKDVAVDEQGRVYILNTDGIVARYTSWDLSNVLVWPMAGSAHGGYPSGIGYDRKNRVFYVGDWDGTVGKYTPDGQLLKQWNAGTNVRDLAVDDKGMVYVADYLGNSIIKYNSDGECITSFEVQYGDWQSILSHGPFSVAARPTGELLVLQQGFSAAPYTGYSRLLRYARGRGEVDIDRVSGQSRYLTAVQACRSRFETAAAVVVATGEKFPDALSASGLAGSLHAPLLLSPTAALPGYVADEIRRLGASKIYVIGSTAALSRDVEKSLAAIAPVTRLQGRDRYETAASVAGETIRLTGAPEHSFFVSGQGFADAVSVSALAYRTGSPVLLVTQPSVPPAVRALAGGSLGSRVVVGGSSVVSDDVVASLAATRVAGANRYATSAAVADWAWSNGLIGQTFVGMATGADFPDALSGGMASGASGGMLVLTRPDSLDTSTTELLRQERMWLDDVTFFGGHLAIRGSVITSTAIVLQR